jgi:hypothetical protein
VKLLLVCLEFGEDIFAVGVGVNIGPVLDDLAVGRDEDGIALGEFVIAACGDGNAVGIDDLVVRISEELEGERVLAAEGLVAFDGVERDAKDDGVEGFILGKILLKFVSFYGATGGHVLGVEVEDDPLALVIGEADHLVFLRWQGEVGGWGTDGYSVGCGGVGANAERSGGGQGQDCCEREYFAHRFFLLR